MRKRKMVTYALAAILSAGMVLSNPVSVHASEVGDILDGMFGGNKPEEGSGDYDGPSYGHGEVESDSEINWGPSDSEPSTPSQPSGQEKPSAPSQPSAPEKPAEPSQPSQQEKPSGSSGQETSGVSGQSGNGGSGNNSAAGSTSDNTGTKEEAVTTPAGGTVTAPVAGCVTVAVTDPTLLAVFPGAVFVYTPEGNIFFNCLSTDGSAYNVWLDGQLADQFGIMDSAGKVVAISSPKVVNTEDGKTYVDVTVAKEITGVKVLATEAQKSAFTRLFGIDGVMVNGILVEEFKDTVQN